MRTFFCTTSPSFRRVLTNSLVSSTLNPVARTVSARVMPFSGPARSVRKRCSIFSSDPWCRRYFAGRRACSRFSGMGRLRAERRRPGVLVGLGGGLRAEAAARDLAEKVGAA